MNDSFIRLCLTSFLFHKSWHSVYLIIFLFNYNKTNYTPTYFLHYNRFFQLIFASFFRRRQFPKRRQEYLIFTFSGCHGKTHDTWFNFFWQIHLVMLNRFTVFRLITRVCFVEGYQIKDLIWLINRKENSFVRSLKRSIYAKIKI